MEEQLEIDWEREKCYCNGKKGEVLLFQLEDVVTMWILFLVFLLFITKKAMQTERERAELNKYLYLFVWSILNFVSSHSIICLTEEREKKENDSTTENLIYFH